MSTDIKAWVLSEQILKWVLGMLWPRRGDLVVTERNHRAQDVVYSWTYSMCVNRGQQAGLSCRSTRDDRIVLQDVTTL